MHGAFPCRQQFPQCSCTCDLHGLLLGALPGDHFVFLCSSTIKVELTAFLLVDGFQTHGFQIPFAMSKSAEVCVQTHVLCGRSDVAAARPIRIDGEEKRVWLSQSQPAPRGRAGAVTLDASRAALCPKQRRAGPQGRGDRLRV